MYISFKKWSLIQNVYVYIHKYIAYKSFLKDSSITLVPILYLVILVILISNLITLQGRCLMHSFLKIESK